MASNHHHHVIRTLPPTAVSERVARRVGRAWRAVVGAVVLACGIGLDARGGQITSGAFQIEVTNGLVGRDNKGNLISQASTGSRLSVLERWNLQSQPVVSITNLSTDTSLIGLQLDLSNSAAKIVSCDWLEAPDKASWNWHDPSASALFQFLDPIAPGEAVTMRLGTAARPNNQGLRYSMNQALFHPCLGGCLTTNNSFGEFTLFFRPLSETLIPRFDDTGRPLAGTSESKTVSFHSARILGDQVTSLTANSTVVVPVPEPGALALAASALGIATGYRGLRRKAA